MVKKKGNSDKNTDKRLLNLIPFQPGQCGNPKGRPRLSDEEKKARQQARHEVVRYQKYKTMSLDQLKNLDTKMLPAVDVIIIRKIIDDIKNSDTTELHRMWSRQLGAPKTDGENPKIDLSNSKVVIRIATGQTQDSEDGG